MLPSPVRTIALYLPQFHPIAENDAWWGRGFTEWTNTAKAVPRFKGHQQPHVPADLGFYDLRLAESRAAQAQLAAQYGIEAFCYYHYWFAGRRLLERPFEEVVASRQPDFPFCLCWANQTWSGVWHGAPKTVLMEQTYPGADDHKRHFDALLPAFSDPRYVRIDGRPVFWIYDTTAIPALEATLELWRGLAQAAGLGGLYLVGTSRAGQEDLTALGFDAVMDMPPMTKRGWVSRRNPAAWLRQQYEVRRGIPLRIDFGDYLQSAMPLANARFETYPIVMHAFDNTPRSGVNGVVYTGSSPETFAVQLRAAIAAVADKPRDRRIIVLKSWNEWAEGNHLEPDLHTGHGYLEALAATLGHAAVELS